MRRKVAVALVAILVALSFAGMAFAAHGAATIKGEVIAVDLSAKTLTIEAQFGPTTFRVHDRAARGLANLKPGDKVEVSTHSFTVGGPREGESDWMPTAEVVTKD